MERTNIIEQMSQEATVTEAAIVLLDAVLGPLTDEELCRYSRKMEDGFLFFNENDVAELIAARRAKLARVEEQA